MSGRLVWCAALLLALSASGSAYAQEPAPGVPVPTPGEPAAPDGDAPAPGPPGLDAPAPPESPNADVDDADDVDDAEQDVRPEGALAIIVVDAAPYGIDPVVGRHVTDQMRATAAAMGYRVLAPDQTIAAAQGLRMPYPPSPADLWRVTYASQSQRGAFARVWAHGGAYVIEISVASLDNTGPFFARGNAGASDLHAVTDRLFRQALPPPETWQQPGGGTPAVSGAATFAQAARGAPPETDEQRRAREQQEIERRAREEEDRRRTEEVLRRRWHLVLQTEGAIGTSQDGFYNHMIGGRIDFRVTRNILLGVYAAYANLQGKETRADNIYFALMVEDRIRISSASDISIPLRLSVGYLPFNGPVIRLSAGLNIPLSDRFELGFDLLAPTFWILPDRTAVSLNIAAELILRI